VNVVGWAPSSPGSPALNCFCLTGLRARRVFVLVIINPQFVGWVWNSPKTTVVKFGLELAHHCCVHALLVLGALIHYVLIREPLIPVSFSSILGSEGSAA
jgi:hypothetical protein